MGVLLMMVAYLASIAVEILSRRAGRHKLETVIALFSANRGKDACGLSVLRGCALGLALLGVDTLAVWLTATYFGGRLSLIHLGLLGGIINGSAWPLGLVLGVCMLQMVGVPLLIAFADAVARRVPVRPWIATIGAATLLAATGIRVSMGAVQPVPFTALVLFVDYTLLLVTFAAFDLLTLAAAIGTFAFWWANYPLFVMQQPIGAAGPWTAFVVWGLCVAGATALAFQSALRRGYHRLAAAFD
jgi:hypothetical protein